MPNCSTYMDMQQ